MTLRVISRVMFCLVASVLCGYAWQNAFSSVPMQPEQFHSAIESYVLRAVGQSRPLEPPNAGSAVTAAVYAMSDSARATLVRELGLAAKNFVMSPEFAASYDAYLANRNAINHGITVTDASADMEKALSSGNMDAMEDATAKMMRESVRRSASEQLGNVKNLTPEVLPYIVDAFEGMMGMAPPRNAAEKAEVAKAQAALKQARQLAATDIEAARAAFRSALMVFAGVQNDEQLATAKNDDKKIEEQRNYNRLALKPNLKKKLTEFVNLAKTVDFNAATQMKGDKKVFVNRAYEGRDELWKMLYRLGPGGTKAAIAVAQAWAAEL
jgi:hypothetical protein